ncbi:anti-sigma factor [Paenibacillus puerhi]|uniref:zf-HC2 domain-containing protein n=1 Tax=Paenibacillus puerhi TaxID=2692622 RepID=UPI0013595ED6|nr:zf-HC2 domain-containing protein [Paenibacillus puerhi]
MTHVPEEQWLLFASGQLESDERQRCEDHLEQCDECLALYAHAVERLAYSLPEPDMDQLAEGAMQRWEERYGAAAVNARCSLEEKHDRRRNWMRHPIFHYTVAAAITLILMGSGVFQVFTQNASAWVDTNLPAESEELPPSWSEQVMERTVGLLATIQPKEKLEERRGKHDE